MMNATIVSAGAAASGYYKTEGYYAADSAEGRAAAEWYGKEAERLGLVGRVDDAVFAELLQGQTLEKTDAGLSHGRQMGRIVEGERQHRPGLDLTFSAPKSVSVAALVLEDERLIEAHDKATRVALDYVQDNLVQTRRYNDGGVVTVTDGDIIAGVFRHDTSRALDPQLHSHAVIANMVRNDDGSITALEPRKIFEQQKLLSEIYRSELALRAHDLGYTVNRVGPHQLIELAEVPKDLADGFSKRRAEIEAALAKRGEEITPRAAELAALATRAAKHGEVDRDELRQNWKNEAKELGFEDQTLAEISLGVRSRGALRLGGVTRGFTPSPATAAVDMARAHLEERSTSFTKPVLLETTLKFGNGLSIGDVSTAVKTAQTQKSLITIGRNSDGDEIYTTRAALEAERDIMRAFRSAARKSGISSRVSYADRTRSIDYVLNLRVDQKEGLTEGQSNAIKTALTGKSRYVAVQGFAGTGKTYALNELRKVAGAIGYEVEGLAPSGQAVAELKSALPNSETVQARLLRGRSADQEADPRKTILVVDESSMLDNAQMRALMQSANRDQIARVVFVGDRQQLDGVGAGTPFALLQRSGIATAHMEDIVRQRDDDLRDAVLHSIKGDISAAFKKIGSNFVVDPDIAQRAAEEYVSLRTSGQNVAVVTPSNAVRRAINENVRDSLQSRGVLDPTDHNLQTLRPLNLTEVQAAHAASYTPGDVLIAYQSVAKDGLKRGDSYVVEAVGKSVISISDSAGNTRDIELLQGGKAAKALQAFEAEERSFSIGEEVKFRIQDKANGVLNGDRGRIEAISDQHVVISDKNGNATTLPHDNQARLGMDHAYAMTGHDAQGASIDHVIVAMGANEYLANQKSFYVGVSRAVETATLVTDDAERLAERVEKNSGAQLLALDEFVKTRNERDGVETGQSDDTRKDTSGREPDLEQDQEKERERETTERQMIMGFERGRDLEDLARQISREERTR